MTFAAPLADETVRTTVWENSKSYGTGGGILGFIVLVINILVWIELFKSSRPPIHKLLWAVAVFLLPIVGPVLYYFFSDRAKWNDSGYEAIPS